ncbi:MAG: transglycosylase SLT domain-containing protein [Pseudomonadales bacterium]|nr:transglycosylase SLT domain-containing protein [Pseudomonadales bacterium]
MNRNTLSLSAFIATVTSIAFFPLSSSANSHLDNQQLRDLYLKANQAFAAKNIKVADKLTLQLKDYSLYPYLRLRQIQRDIGFIKQSQINQYLKDYANTPMAKRAQASYLSKLVRAKQWSSYLNNYQRLPLRSAHYTCYQLQAKINTGSGKKISAQIAKLWNVGNSQPKTCDPVFSYWIKQGNPTSKIAYQRSWKAISNKNYKIARFAQKYVKSKSLNHSLNLFWKVQKNVALIANSKTLSSKTSHGADIAAYAIRKLAVKKPELALKTWLRDRIRLSFSAEQRKYLNVYFGNKFAKSTYYDPAAPGILQKLDPLYKYDDISEWKIRLALIKQDWKQVIGLIGSSPQSIQSKNRWVYWLETAKQKANPAGYIAKYDPIIAERDFYGFVAAELKGSPFILNHKKTNISSELLNKLLKLSAVARIRELVKTGDTANAYQEWRVFKDSLNKQQTLAMGYLVSNWGWHIQGIRIAAKLKAWNELSIRFPRSQNALFAELGAAKGIGNTWPVANARQESAYNQYARSPAGARGFMQLMPATAKMTAKKFAIPYRGKDELYDPRTNISLGTAYLGEMMKKFNNQAHSTAAYNAGPHRVELWLKSRGKLPLDIWIETIPFDETRHYVQNVLTYSAIYDLLAGRKAMMFTAKDRAQLTLNRS